MLDEFIAKARSALAEDPNATITSPDGKVTPLKEFLANYDRQQAERVAKAN